MARAGLVSSAVESLMSVFERKDEREFLPAALEVVETPVAPLTRLFGLIIVSAFLIAVAWAFLGRVDIQATAQGRILPAGDVKTIEPLDPGTVRAIHVQDGDHVQRGQALIELDPTQPQADQARLAQDLVRARLDVARLSGLAAGFLGGSLRFSPPADAPADLVAEARAAMEAQAAQQAARVADLSRQMDAKASEVAEGEAAAAKLVASIPLLEEKDKVNRDLDSHGYGTKLAALDAARELSDARHDLSIARRKVEESASAREALARQRAGVQAQFRADVLADLRKAQTQVAELQEELVKAADKSALTVIRAPNDGVVEDLAVHTLHGVVLPGERLMTLVPDTRDLMIEARLANKDVGFVHPGQSVKVKVETFNFTRYGLIAGKVIDVSRDTAPEPPREPQASAGSAERPTPIPSAASPAYSARIALSRTDMMIDGARRPLTPGMAITAEIRTGSRSIADYLISPIARRGEESLHER